MQIVPCIYLADNGNLSSGRGVSLGSLVTTNVPMPTLCSHASALLANIVGLFASPLHLYNLCVLVLNTLSLLLSAVCFDCDCMYLTVLL